MIPETPKELFARAELPTGDRITRVPMEAPWLTAYGMGFIMITALRENQGVIEAQLANEDHVPYNDGDTWCPLDEFPEEWPD